MRYLPGTGGIAKPDTGERAALGGGRFGSLGSRDLRKIRVLRSQLMSGRFAMGRIGDYRDLVKRGRWLGDRRMNQPMVGARHKFFRLLNVIVPSFSYFDQVHSSKVL